MDNQDLLSKLKFYEERIGLLEKELDESKTHLKKYTAPSNMKKYYETHKEEIKQRVKEYREKTNYIVSKDVIKERNKRAALKNKTCKSGWCSIFVGKKYEGYCLFCYIHLFPDKPITHNYKTKEQAVVDFIKSKFPDLSWVADKRVNGGCSRRRPDLLLDLGYQVIIVEVDENQHTDYDCSCQNKRIMELSQDLGHRPIVFIRFNPDAFKQNNTVISSCWGYHNSGVCKVKKSKQIEWEQRLNTLEEQLRYWINPENTTNKTVETVQLFYDM